MNIQIVSGQGHEKRLIVIKFEGIQYLLWVVKDYPNVFRIAKLPSNIAEIKSCYYSYGDYNVTTEENATWYVPYAYADACEKEDDTIMLEKRCSKDSTHINVKKIELSKNANVMEIFSLLNALYQKYIYNADWTVDKNNNNQIDIEYIGEKITIKNGEHRYYCFKGLNDEILVSPIPAYTQYEMPKSYHLTYDDKKCIYVYENGEKSNSFYEVCEEIQYRDFVNFIDELIYIIEND